MVDAVAIPHRLEQAVGETERENVLHGFLAQEMIDAEHLIFVQHLGNRGIEMLGAGQIVAEGFFHDYPAPAFAFVLPGRPASPRLSNTGSKKRAAVAR